MIKKREIIASIIFISIYLICGLYLSDYINNKEIDENSVYNKAIKIDSKDLFEYGMSTNVGNAFVYGNLLAIDTVSYPEVNGEYMYIERVTEEYTSHIRTVNGKTQIYYTWDEIDTDSKRCNKILFCDNEFDSSKILFTSTSYISKYNVSNDTRYKFYGVGLEYTGTVFTYLGDNTISDNSLFVNGKTAEEACEYLCSRSLVLIFWIFWIILGIGCVYGFYTFENEWLD